jgi:hypothetical protein
LQVELSYKSLNKGDVFILDAYNKLYVWTGSKANRMEVAKGVDVANRIRDKERKTRATVVSLAEDDENEEFWQLLGGRHPIAEPEIAGVDEDTDNEHVEILYKYTSAYWSHFN